jgi:NAD(P)H-dependent FMN reductase
VLVLGLSGSLRRDSYNSALLRHAGDLFEAEGAEFEIYDGLRDIRARAEPPCVTTLG